MRKERRLHALAHHARRENADASEAMPSYLSRITLGATLQVAPDLKTAAEIVFPDHTVETRTPFAEAS
jgi:hypothetical protein